MLVYSPVTSGLKGLDKIIGSLQTGDNVVLQVDDMEDYRFFVGPFVRAALAKGRRVVYMRFAHHPPLLAGEGGVVTYRLNAERGFESFSTQVHNIVRQEGRDVFYVFDSLSDLLLAWATDLMIGNFFVITCPYLFELNTVAYFALLRGRHSFKTVARIRETTQVLLDIYNYQGRICVHPLKVWNRYSPTMFLPHILEGDDSSPVLSSVDATNLFSFLAHKSTVNAERHLDYWDRIFLEARDLLPDDSPEGEARKKEMVDTLSRILIGREKRMLALARDYFNLEDLLEIKDRLIGTGFIGGKSVGMLLARNILRQDKSWDWAGKLEHHDSYYIGSDVFYAYIVENGWWRLLMTHKTRDGYFEAAAELREKMLVGTFPEEIKEQFLLMLEYFGQSPIIVRSSSLLEDAFGNAFAGKYASFFCANQGSPQERYEVFADYVRRVFASTMNEDALTYRLERGLDRQDEQMALLVQRVSGSYRGRYFFPDIAGVGLSYNTFVWNPELDPRAGMLRLVYGLGTRAVNRVENDYPRIVALDAPLVKPHSGLEDARRYSQHEVDCLDLGENRFQSLPLGQLAAEGAAANLELFAVPDLEARERMRARGRDGDNHWILTFDEFLSRTDFPRAMSAMLKALEAVYDYPVDIEFTGNFNSDGCLQINLLQCRPFQTKGKTAQVAVPARVPGEDLLLSQEGNFMGGSVSLPISRVIYVDPRGYASLTLSEKYDVARVIGRLNRMIAGREAQPTLLLGPGRWGTTTPAMGVPVTFAEISRVAVIGEIAYRDGSLIPDLSFGSHFFQDLVEMDIFYLAVYPEREGVVFNASWLKRHPNLLKDLSPRDVQYEGVVGVYDTAADGLRLLSDVVTRRVLCAAGLGA
ncbi:MAG TPA: PEP/pyruvate-binding domain-containing protein [Syntrophales bacterium]|nr:PEP/pyruvate-binding domain-containing protein [Syntrophales bacterium]HOM07152.1 PEP/pyruvate-binding domain-containing protein [Syntrophales bacterium]HOO00575.1 PEP/pyruvate-binding domain-containing protein [Syntrophales bacterium]HPC01828.1 PEP/pyruvate-binding domain-containing protein [Syntrophales bacterium]HPQ05487.1 PEP/pyruvate-binding domain-containing protein [Syntrophales bacterium]